MLAAATAAAAAISTAAIALFVTLALFGVFVAFRGLDPFLAYATLFQGAFGSWFSVEQTLTQAAPLMLTALCTALPARAGLLVIGGEARSSWVAWPASSQASRSATYPPRSQ